MKWLLNLFRKKPIVLSTLWSWSYTSDRTYRKPPQKGQLRNDIGSGIFCITRYEIKNQDGTIQTDVIGSWVSGRPYWCIEDLNVIQHGVDAQQYRKMLIELIDETMGEVQLVLRKVPLLTVRDNKQQTRMVYRPGRNDWLVETWKQNGNRCVCLSDSFTHPHEAFGWISCNVDEGEVLHISGHKGAGKILKVNETDFTYLLFRDPFGILGIVPENWEEDSLGDIL